MRKEIKEFVARISDDMTLDEIEKVCQNEEEFDYVFANLKNVKTANDIVLPLSLRLRAKFEFKNVPKEEITTVLVQKQLSIGYGRAWAIKEWLIKSKGENK